MSEEATDAEATKREGIGSLHREVPGLDRGSFVGRYVILDVVGQGGMGIVYSAFDPELDRKVAIKLLQAGEGSSSTSAGSQAWLVREAQAMARLSHPNVIAVHDVGTLPGDRVFVAMELVEGVTLREWCKTARTWREVLHVISEAGAGLAAAHAVGLVHRDFKPDNVLVAKDGRVRVMDFGLARLRPDDEASTPASRNSDLSIESRSPLTDTLTEVGTVMGTPAYMAPEIHDGLGAGPRSDQFAFGVALYEALYRVRPFDKKALAAPRDPGLKPKPPPDSKKGNVPARVQRAVMRAIAIDPQARFATMDELLAELVVAPPQRRSLWIAAGLIVLLAAGGGVFALTRTQVPQCIGTEQRLAGVWDPQIKLAVKRGFTNTKKAYADRAYAGLEHALDAYTSEWTEAAIGNCEATRIRHEQTERVQVLRQACLDQRLEEVKALSQLLVSPNDTLVEKADKAVWELEPIKRCANVLALATPNEPTAANRAKYTELTKKIAFARAQAIGGQLFPALTAASTVLEGAKEIHAEDLQADALLVRGGALTMAGNTIEALQALDESTWTAMRCQRDDIVVQASLSAAIAYAEQSANPDMAEVWLKLANAAAVRIGLDKMLELRRLEAQGVIDAQRGNFVAAVATHEKALAAATAVYGANSPALWQPEELLAASMGRAGGWVAAVPHLERALALREAAVGPDHPDVALIASNLGACYDHAGDSKRGLALFERALAIREKTYGPKSPFLVATLNNLADFKLHNDDLPGALDYILRARAIAEKLPGKTNPMFHVIETTHGEVLGALHRTGEARATFDEVLELELKFKSPELGTTLAARGALELAEHTWADAIAFEERSIAAYEASGDKEQLDLWKPLFGLATAKRALDPKADVRPLLERAVAIGTKAQLKTADLQPIKDALAKL